ncbi:RNA polymerase sigma factor [Paenibacillus sp. NPDC058177]|uniref:RNA polymerase sigma factor n=1 Tax=Paenibacillus sp. NPDC058177 TaxID=3346369 RepID=UPI0036DD5EEB
MKYYVDVSVSSDLHCYISIHKERGGLHIDTTRIEEYIQQVQQGAAEAFIPIVEAYQRQLFIYCCRLLGDEQDAEDAVQDIFLKAYKSIYSYAQAVSFSAWLYKIAYHHCLNLIRKRQLYDKLSRLWKGHFVAESAEQEYLRGVFNEPLSKALTKLSAEERSLLILYVFHEKSYTEIGEIAGKSPEAVRKKITRVRNKVKDNINSCQEEGQWEHSWIQTKS